MYILDNTHARCALRIAGGITVLVLLLAGGAGAASLLWTPAAVLVLLALS